MAAGSLSAKPDHELAHTSDSEPLRKVCQTLSHLRRSEDLGSSSGVDGPLARSTNFSAASVFVVRQTALALFAAVFPAWLLQQNASNHLEGDVRLPSRL